MTVTAHVTHDSRRTFGVSHGPITRPDPIRSDPALLLTCGHLPSIASLSYARAASEPSDAHQPHATASAWMRADR